MNRHPVSETQAQRPALQPSAAHATSQPSDERPTAEERDAPTASAPLAELVADIARLKANAAPPDGILAAMRAAYPEVHDMEYFRATWTRLNGRRQLRQALANAPENAGPLNSSSVVHRAIVLMRELSPGYLQHFLAHLDALSWMEQLANSVEAARNAARAGGGRKSGRGK
ncbi:DUF2894 domain-containing protein [Paracandidimonas lactea]|uniref:DUF2894 domain-containing protein n=1 Tax=Paracandidimonas lactea TaxID=2895524 RepID=UPI001F416552|nr:DUF2894 domain-containing protein [Paracandidimonas lactea]